MRSPQFPPELNLTHGPAAIDDAAELAQLFNAIGEAAGTPERLSAESMEHELTAFFDPLEDKTLVVKDDAGTIAAYSTVYYRPAEAAEARSHINVHIPVERRGSGIDGPMLEWAIEAATTELKGTDAERWFVCAWMYKKQKDLSTLVQSRGFEEIRHWWEMERMLDLDIDDVPEDRFELIPWEDQYNEPARLVSNEAFADHWGSTPMAEEDWQKQLVDSPNFRRQFSYVAVADGEVVGYSSCEEYPEDSEAAGRREAWIGGLGVLRKWRKRGIATALLAGCMRAMKAGGVDAAMIGVDSDSPSGAQHLYSSVGFKTTITASTWQLEVE